MSNGLDILKRHRDALLLAEAAAWLHDMGKCADEHLINQASDRPPGYSYQYKIAHSSLIAAAPPLSVLGESVVFQTLVEQARPAVVNDANHPWLLRVLGRCHAAAHIEKEEADRSGKQRVSDTRMSTAFGCERSPLSGLTTALRGLPYANLTDRTIFRAAVRQAFSTALGETRRPENEITLWDWSDLVGALYKAALAGALLGYKPQPADIRWRLLSVRVDEAAFLDHVSRLPDLLVRQQLLQNGFERIRQLLEETYPLGTEVYRDENGSLYVVPNLANLATLADAAGTTLETLIRREFAQGTINDNPALTLSGEIGLNVEFDVQSWWGQRPDFRNQPQSIDEVPPVGQMLQRDVSTHADAATVVGWWAKNTRDICPVCGLRPQADPRSKHEDEHKAGERRVCVVCEQRRANRAQEWSKNLGTTIWTDEVADDNGRLALVVGQFDLERWLDGTQVQTLTVTDPAQDGSPQKSNVARKNPSFARIRRVWETTRTFWQEISGGLGASVGTGAARLEIRPQEADRLDLGQFHTYELLVNDIRLSVVWDSDNRRFITCDNLSYLAKPEQLGAQVADVVKPGRTFPLEEPVGYGGANRRLGTITVDQVALLPQAYTPAIPILAEPRTFMALVPANKALDVVQAIKKKYEAEMGKVRNRLPLTLGVVYAGRRTPLATLLDGGRRMLRRPARIEQAHVEVISPVNPWPQAVMLTLKVGEWTIPVTVPTIMGDGTTPDVWYPYWQVSDRPTDRKRWFVGPDGEHWVHVCDLRPGDTVAFTPSTFDFEYLDVSSRRFEIAYGDDGRRLGEGKRKRPYLLEQVSDLEDAWQQISHLTTSQIKGVEALIEAKRRDWGEPTGTLNVSCTFGRFVGDVLHEAEAHSEALEQAAITGLLADALEIHLTIHKDKPQPKEA